MHPRFYPPGPLHPFLLEAEPVSMVKELGLLSLLLFLPVAVQAHGLIPGSPMQQVPKSSIPNAVPMPMMQFPPLQTMHFPKARTLEMVPATDFIDGADLYRRNCSECHGIQTTSEIRGLHFSQVSSAAASDKPGKEKMRLKKEEMMAIIDALKASPAS